MFLFRRKFSTGHRCQGENSIRSPPDAKMASNIQTPAGQKPGGKVSAKEEKGALKLVEEGSGEEHSRSESPPEGAGEKLKLKKQKKCSQINFYSGNHFVEVTKGVLHVCKDRRCCREEQSQMLVILSVPSSVTIHDLVRFLASVQETIEHIRIIRDCKPNHYLVLLKFKNQQGAQDFYVNFDGVPFNSMEPEQCQLAYVVRIEMIRDCENAEPEAQTCPVCLDKLDDNVAGVLTILCNHSFHSQCLAQWGDTSCPVCRYSQIPELCQDNLCFTCSSQESLWLCLICGNIGCGRYVEGHAHKHYLESHHTYAMHLENSKVWDYAADNYVHRLVQNKADGKPVELQSLWAESDEKVESMQLEYTHLLTSQLETQRHFFEEQISRLEQDTLTQIEEIKDKTRLAVEERKELESKLTKMTKEKQAQEKKINQLTAKINKLNTEIKEEKAINKCLEENDLSFKKTIDKLQKELGDFENNAAKERLKLQAQLNELMLRLDQAEAAAAAAAPQATTEQTADLPSPSPSPKQMEQPPATSQRRKKKR
ncbi:BRAP [Cordylochernes scorpioides]|uniref:BRAP n=1 Tax=Cordylochernes scorpioides TaxID=51811 RepID=A0ABY6K6B1_9ARAC|nr:BRAP [Cordylochernes scorpioides]